MGRQTKMRPATVVFLYFFVVTARGKLNGLPETALDLENVLLQGKKLRLWSLIVLLQLPQKRFALIS